MDDLASSLRVSKRTIYQNFENKEDVLKNCILEAQEHRAKRYTEIIRRSDNIVIRFLDILCDYKSIKLPRDTFLEDIHIFYPNIYQTILSESEKYQLFMKELIRVGIKEGYFRSDINPEETVWMLDMGTYMRISIAHSRNGTAISTDLIYNMMVNILRGISTRKGLEIIDAYIPISPNLNN